MSNRRLLSGALSLSIGWIFLHPSGAFAACSPAVTSGANVTCTGTSGTVGDGSGTTNGQDAVTVNVSDGATVNGGAGYGIVLHDNATVNVGTGAGATALVTNAGGAGPAVDGAGFNTIQFNSNSTLTVQTNGQVIQTGGTTRTEAVNPTGISNTITNHGLIQNGQGPAIWFQDIVTDPNTFNTIDNYGTIRTTLKDAGGNLTSVIGATDKGIGNGAVHFINQSTGIRRRQHPVRRRQRPDDALHRLHHHRQHRRRRRQQQHGAARHGYRPVERCHQQFQFAPETRQRHLDAVRRSGQ